MPPGWTGGPTTLASDSTLAGTSFERRDELSQPALGSLIGGRYEVQAAIGAGGAGVVLRARDRTSGALVAVKTTLGAASDAAAAFEREARLLASLQHPAIVRYLDHGVAATGAPFLVMELLTGESLRDRVGRAPLAPAQACKLVARLLDALAFAHARGIVHRDVKPSNLFLPGGSLEQAKLLDFGVARDEQAWLRTVTGTVVGTPLYMAPEQADGVDDVDGRADVFAAGAVLVECITGRPVFAGAGLASIAKLALSDLIAAENGLELLPPPVAELAVELLAHDRDRRPRDASAVAARLLALAPTLEPRERPAAATRALGARETRPLVVLLVGPSDAGARAHADEGAVESIARRHGATLQPLLSGACVLSFGIGGAREQAVRAARAALELRETLTARSIAVALGRATVERHALVGAAIDETTRLVALGGDEGDAEVCEIRLDEAVAELLAGAFEVESRTRAGEVLRVLRREAGAANPRPLLGRDVPFVGRDRELASLEAAIDDAFDEPRATAALVLAPAGGGKSRFRRELVGHVADQWSALVLTGEPDALRAGAPYGVLGSALRAAAGFAGGDDPEARARKLAALVDDATAIPDAADRARIVAFLGEIAGLPARPDDPPAMRSARLDARIMVDQVRLAWVDFVAGALARGPLLLVLEDLHWGDAPSVHLVDAALRAHRDRALFVLGLARPEVDDRFPNLWRDSSERVRLAPLRSRAARELVRAVLPELPRDRLDSLVARADGNPFFLEELVRVEAQGTGAATPATVLAAVQTRLDQLGDDGKRVLRAASVFGESFSGAGVAALLDPRLAPDLAGWLQLLVARELINPAGEGRAPRDDRFVFRHALVRDGAYDTLTDADRRLGHRLAAEFLERTGERDAVVLAGHWERAGELTHAARCCCVAAEQALDANDFAGVLERCARALRAGADGAQIGTLRLTEAKARVWRGEWLDAERAAREALLWLSGDARAEALWALLVSLGQQQRSDDFVRHYDELLKLADRPTPSRVWRQQVLRVCGYHVAFGERDALWALLDDQAELEHGPDGLLRGLWLSLRSQVELFSSDLVAAHRDAEAATRELTDAGDLREACTTLTNVVCTLGELGRIDEAERVANEHVALARRIEHGYMLPFALANLASLRLSRGDLDGARHAAEQTLELSQNEVDARVRGFAHVLQAQIALAEADAAAARSFAERATEVLSGTPTLLLTAEAALARALTLMGDHDAAAKHADSSLSALHALGGAEHGEFLVWLASIEVARARGDDARARRIAADAMNALEARLGAFADPADRARVLAGIPDASSLGMHARALGVAVSHRTDLPDPRTE